MPDITAHAPDGTVHNFPDGTDPAIVDRTMKQYITGGAGNVPLGTATPFPGAPPQPTGLTPPPKDPLSPAERRAVSSRPGSPLNLGGEGGLGKLQASLWGLSDYERQKQLGQAARGEAAPQTPTGSFADIGAEAASIGGDIAGLVGAPFASPKAAALTAGSQTPIVRAAILPYLAYQGAKMAAGSRQPQESEADFLQRILLGGSMATGSVAGMRAPTNNLIKFVDRARSLESINKASVGLLQGKLAPLAVKMDALMENRVKTRAQAMEQADSTLQAQRGGQPTMTPTNLTQAHAQFPSPIFESAKAANLFVESSQQLPGSTFATMRDLRTRIGRTASALERGAGKGNDARILWSLYDGISKDMETHATGPLNMPGQWRAYNTDATAMFDIQKGKLGHLFDTQQYSAQHPGIRLFTKGETPAIALINELGNKSTTPTGEVSLWKEHMSKLGLNPAELTDSLEHARTLSSAHDSFTGKGQMGGMWRIATAGGPTALLALGIYGAAHGMGIYGMMPYLMAIGATRGRSTLGAKMDAGVTMKELEQSLPPEAFRVGRALSDQPLPTTGAGVNPPPPPAPTVPPVPPPGTGGGPTPGAGGTAATPPPTSPAGGGSGSPAGETPDEFERRAPSRGKSMEQEVQEAEAKSKSEAEAKRDKWTQAQKVEQARKQRSVYKGKR